MSTTTAMLSRVIRGRVSVSVGDRFLFILGRVTCAFEGVVCKRSGSRGGSCGVAETVDGMHGRGPVVRLIAHP